MGRKKKEFSPSKEVNFHFRITELYEVLQKEAVSADMTLSDYEAYSEARAHDTKNWPILKSI